MRSFFGTLLIVAALGNLASAKANPNVKRVLLGTLSCTTEGASGFASAAIKNISCTFRRRGSDVSDVYRGEILRRDPRLNHSAKTIFVWKVWGPEDKSKQASLIGKYYNIGNNLPTAVKVSENTLIGGASKAILLEPIIKEDASSALNMILDIAELKLRPARI